MKLNEATAELRRLFTALYDDTGTITTVAADGPPPAGTIQVSKNGAAFTNGAGTFAHVSDGIYYYEATIGEADTEGFLLVKFERAGFNTAGWHGFVGFPWTIGETDTTKLRFPVAIYNDASPPALTTGATVAVAAELQLSLNGAAFANAAGTLPELADGFYYYQGVTADAAAEGTLILKYEKATFSTTTLLQFVEDPPDEDVVDTSLTAATTPGDLDADPTTARWTPVHLEFPAAPGHKVTIIAQIGDSSALWMVAYDESLSPGGVSGQTAYAPLFSTKSTIEITGTIGSGREFVMDILPNGGWQREVFRLVPYLTLELT